MFDLSHVFRRRAAEKDLSQQALVAGLTANSLLSLLYFIYFTAKRQIQVYYIYLTITLQKMSMLLETHRTGMDFPNKCRLPNNNNNNNNNDKNDN